MPHTTQTFPYRFVDESKFPRPSIPVTLRSQKRMMQPLLALVDSGADFYLFDGELSYLLDIDLTKLEKMSLSGVAGAGAGDIVPHERGVEDTFFSLPVGFWVDFSPKGLRGGSGQVRLF